MPAFCNSHSDFHMEKTESQVTAEGCQFSAKVHKEPKIRSLLKKNFLSWGGPCIQNSRIQILPRHQPFMGPYSAALSKLLQKVTMVFFI